MNAITIYTPLHTSNEISTVLSLKKLKTNSIHFGTATAGRDLKCLIIISNRGAQRGAL